MIADAQFHALWRQGKHRQAIGAYRKVGRLFWLADQVGRYYERRGLIKKAVAEYEYQMDIYSKMGKNGILPLPRGPRELFFLGKYFSCRNSGKAKAKRYLLLYLDAERQWKGDPAFYLRHKNSTKNILNRLEMKNDKENCSL